MVFRKRFLFGTKGETLERLAPSLTKSEVPAFVRFTVHEWKEGRRADVLQRIRQELGDGPVIVRSSALGEDSESEARAGAFLSIPDVPAADAAAVTAAVDDVIASYRKHATGAAAASDAPGNQVIVQRMITDVLMTGVLLTQDLNTGAPYYVINYDDQSGRTETITAGSHYSNRTLYVFRGAREQLSSRRFLRVLEAVSEIEALVDDTCLDIEFALGQDLEVYVFQVRQITTQPNWNRGLTLQIEDSLQRLRQALVQRYARAGVEDGLGGAILANMSDWNPAEMIGTTPRRLAFSLYRRLITDRSWREARRAMGYREQRGMPLMTSLAGQPYIDVRESFRSFLPARLPAELGDALVSAWLDRLRENHHLHDKVEFDVAVTAFCPTFDQRVREQCGDLTAEQAGVFRECSRALTNDLVTGRVAAIGDQLEQVERLARRRASILADASAPSFEMLSELLEDAVDWGTIPFSVLARHAFVASTLLRALVARGAIGPDDLAAFQRSVPTVATELVRDVRRFVDGELDEEGFLERYGHLRPGTYDILSLRYDQRLAGLTAFAADRQLSAPPEAFRFGEAQRRDVTRLLQAEGIEADADGLLEYCRAATQAREYAKFVFTHNVSDSLEIVAALGARHGLSREELSYLAVHEFLDAFVEPSGRSIESHLRSLAERGRESHRVTNAIRLPSVIDRITSLFIVPLSVEQPNFITRKNARGTVVLLQGADLDVEKVDGKIVAIQSADPGFDWIFSRSILGLITKYGGANSHMAIRCAEFGLPAAIGCGEQIFERAVRSGCIELKCAEGQILDA